MTVKSFKELEVWKCSLDIVKCIYVITQNKDFSKDFALKNQIRRASISISSNIAEGFDRSNNKEFVRFLKIAKASAAEVHCQILIAYELSYIDRNKLENLADKLDKASNQIGKLISYLKSNIKDYNKTSNK